MSKKMAEIPAQVPIPEREWRFQDLKENQKSNVRNFSKDVRNVRKVSINQIADEGERSRLTSQEKLAKVLQARLKTLLETSHKYKDIQDHPITGIDFFDPYNKRVIDRLLLTNDELDLRAKQRVGSSSGDYLQFIQEFCDEAQNVLGTFQHHFRKYSSESDVRDAAQINFWNENGGNLWDSTDTGVRIRNQALRSGANAIMLLNPQEFRIWVTNQMHGWSLDDPVVVEMEAIIFGRKRKNLLSFIRENTISRLQGLTNPKSKDKREFFSPKTAEVWQIAAGLGIVNEQGEIDYELVEKLREIVDNLPSARLEDLLKSGDNSETDVSGQ